MWDRCHEELYISVLHPLSRLPGPIHPLDSTTLPYHTTSPPPLLQPHPCISLPSMHTSHLLGIGLAFPWRTGDGTYLPYLSWAEAVRWIDGSIHINTYIHRYSSMHTTILFFYPMSRVSPTPRVCGLSSYGKGNAPRVLTRRHASLRIDLVDTGVDGQGTKSTFELVCHARGDDEQDRKRGVQAHGWMYRGGIVFMDDNLNRWRRSFLVWIGLHSGKWKGFEMTLDEVGFLYLIVINGSVTRDYTLACKQYATTHLQTSSSISLPPCPLPPSTAPPSSSSPQPESPPSSPPSAHSPPPRPTHYPPQLQPH